MCFPGVSSEEAADVQIAYPTIPMPIQSAVSGDMKPTYPGSDWEKGRTCWEESGSTLWRAHSDSIHAPFLERCLPAEGVGTLLKTDLFDEAVGSGELARALQARCRCLVGIDLALGTLLGAARTAPGTRALQADVRRLPFPDGAFDAVVSTSTLDHFATPGELVTGLEECVRVLRPGGDLVVTLDNPVNPVVALRNALPFELLHRAGLIPYRMGATLGLSRLEREVARLGLAVRRRELLMHCPRIAAIRLGRIIERRGGDGTRLLSLLAAFEGLGRWPTRQVTGHLVALHGTKR